VRTSSRESGDESPPAKRPRFFDPFAVNNRLSQPSRSIAVIGNEYEAWKVDRERANGDVRDPLAYWANKQDRYPRLSRMTMDFMKIQPMSEKCEIVFSAAGNMVLPRRARLDAVIIGVCQVLRSWYKAGVLPETDLEMAPVSVRDYNNPDNDGDNEELQYKDDRSATSKIDSE
jgi:hypothetical protein